MVPWTCILLARGLGTEVNRLSADSLAELGIDLSNETPKPINPELVRDVDVVVALGREARVKPLAGTRFENRHSRLTQ